MGLWFGDVSLEALQMKHAREAEADLHRVAKHVDEETLRQINMLRSAQ